MEHGTPQPETGGEESWVEQVEQRLPEAVRRVRRRTPRWLRRTLTVLFWLIVLPVLIFQVPWVQNRAAQKLTAYLSEELHTTVSIERAYIGIFNRIILEGFYLADLQGDTLLYAGELRVNHSGLFMLPFRNFKIETLSLKNAEVRISHEAGKKDQNFQFLLDYFSSNKPTDPNAKPAKPFRLNLRHLYLDHVRFLQPDAVRGETRDIFVEKAEAHFNKFDLLTKRIELANLLIERPDVKIRMYPEQPTQVQLTNLEITVPSADTSKLVISIGDFDLTGGRFSMYNTRKEPIRTTPPDILNFNYLDVFDIEVHFKRFTFSDLDFSGEVEQISARDSSGFVLDSLSAKDATLTCSKLELYGFNLKTPYSQLGDTLIFKFPGTYRAFENFVDDVRMDLRFHDASMALHDITTFAPALKNNLFFKENENEVFKIDGQIKGPVNRLDGKNLEINLANGLEIEGNFSTRDLAVPDEQFLHLKLDRLRTDMRTLRKLIPGFKPSADYDRLGRLDFDGKFDGFFTDFVADGNLRTDLGSATMFMNLKLREGKEKAQYSGDLYLRNFDIGRLTGSPDLGRITFDSHVKEGVGLTQKSATALLEAKVDSFRFKGYDYKNAVFKGQLKRNLLDGELTVADKNINLDFRGSVNFADSVPAFNFVADVRRLSLLPLNLTKNDLQFFGKINMNLRGKRLSNIMGDAGVGDFMVVKNLIDTLRVDTATLISSVDSVGKKVFSIQSNLGSADVRGLFDIEEIPNRFFRFLTDNYPRYAQKLGIAAPRLLTDTARFDFKIDLFDLQNLVGFVSDKIEGFDSTEIKGSYNGFNNQLEMDVKVPGWKIQNVRFEDLYFHTKLEGQEGSVQLGVMKTDLGGGRELSPIFLNGIVIQDTVDFLVISSNFFQVLDNINVNGLLTLDDDNAWRISFKPSDLVILNQVWDINTNNYLRIGEGKVETDNFILSHAGQEIILKSVRNEGLELQLNNLPLDSIDYISHVPNFRFQGIADVNAKVKDIFRFEGLAALLRIQDLTVNGDYFGTLRLDASAPSIKETVNGWLSIENDSMELAVDGYIQPPTFEAEKSQRKWLNKEPLYFDFDVSFANYPVSILKYFVAEVSEVKGVASAKKIHAFGLPSRPELAGEVEVKNASFTVNSLRANFRVPNAVVKVGNRLFDGTGGYAYDRLGNRAYIEGGITHDHLKNFGLDVRISTDPGRPFLAMETTEKDNPTMYGTAMGSGFARFTGTFKQPELYANARSMPGTHITIPISNTAQAKKGKFINFTEDVVKNEKEGKAPPPKELRGLNMIFELDLTEDAQVEMIFDKAWGDVLRGNGNGSLNVYIDRNGRFEMFGDYTVASGDYLFTLMNIGFNKPFTIAPGGTVTWAGDPFTATTINIDAVYKGLNTTVYNFIYEFVATNADLETLARNSTPVDLKMRLKGSLLRPDIDFDIEFPNLDSQLKNYAENKLRSIRQDPNELNRQVFGLLVLGQFLATNSIQAQDVGINTLSEMLANQLSIYISDFIVSLVGGDLIQGIDFDLAYNRYSGGTVDNNTDFTGSELQTKIKVTINDRVSVKLGGNFNVGGSSGAVANNSALLGGEFIIEYILTKDRRLSIKAYRTSEPDISGGSRSHTGVGLVFKKEFDTIEELFRAAKKK